MKIAVVDRIIDHLKLTFAAEKPPPEAVLPKLLREEIIRFVYLSLSPLPTSFSAGPES